MRTTTAWQSVNDGSATLTRETIERRDLRPDDIAVRVDFCGVCHSDLHRIRGLLGEGIIVPGHEFTGTVTEAGPQASRAVGMRVAVGPIIDSCGTCPMCQIGQENYCHEYPTTAYGGKDRIDGRPTQGAYSREYVLKGEFAHPLPAALDPAAAAPLMCAGISVWEPMRAAGVGEGSRLAVAGLGGLGHLAVKLASRLGAEVTVLSRGTGKKADALALGAAALLDTTDSAQVAAHRGAFDLILDTISADHDFTPLLHTLDLDGTLCVLGNPLLSMPVRALHGRKRVTTSGVGGRRHTTELLAFCAEHGITADVEVLPSSRVAEAMARLDAGDVRYRFVLDLSDLD